MSGDRAWLFYFTHPGRKDTKADTYETRRSSIQVVELQAGRRIAQSRSRFTDARCAARQVELPATSRWPNFSRGCRNVARRCPRFVAKGAAGDKHDEDKCSRGTSCARGLRRLSLMKNYFIWVTARPESPILATLLVIKASRGSIMSGISAVRAGWRAGLCLFAASCIVSAPPVLAQAQPARKTSKPE